MPLSHCSRRELGVHPAVPRVPLDTQGGPLAGDLVDLGRELDRTGDRGGVLGRAPVGSGGGVLSDEHSRHAQPGRAERGVPEPAEQLDDLVVEIGGEVDLAGVAVQLDHGGAAVHGER